MKLRARSALALALLLSCAVVAIAQDDEEEVSKSIESAEFDVDSSENAETTSTATTTARARQLKGFVTPRPFVVELPIYSSTWAAWSAWSFCVNNVRIRVRACNTVRGFSCVGRNQETQPCSNSLYHHHPQRQRSSSDYDVVDEYEDDRIEALKQLYPDESPSDVIERRKQNPNFLRIGTTTAVSTTAAAASIKKTTKDVDEAEPLSSIERAEEIEEKDTEKSAEAHQQPDTDFKKAKGAKTETQEVPLEKEIEGALERLEVHRQSETRRQHASNYHIIKPKEKYAHDGSMGAGYTILRNNAFAELDLSDADDVTTSAPAKSTTDKKTTRKAKMAKSKAMLAKISKLLDYEIEELERKVTKKPGKSSGIRAVFNSRGEELPGDFVDAGEIDPRYSKLKDARVASAKSSTASTVKGRAKTKKGSDYIEEYSDYSEDEKKGKVITTTPKTKKDVKRQGGSIYDEAVLDTDKATYNEYEEWIGDDKGSREIINKKTNTKNGGSPHDSSIDSIPIRPKGDRTTSAVDAADAADTTTTTTAASTTVQQPQKQGKINFNNSDFLKEILVTDYTDYEDVLHKKKLDGEAEITDITAPSPRPRTTTPRPSKKPLRSDQLNKVHELENLLGLPHQGLMDETLRPQTNPVVWATPNPQFRSEGPNRMRTKIINRKKINKQAKTVAKVDINNVEVDRNVNMIDSDVHTFDGDAGEVISKTVATVKPRKPIVNRKKILKTLNQLREQPTLLDNDDFRSVKGYSPYPPGSGVTLVPRRKTTKGLNKQKALSFGITGKRHRAIHDGQKGQRLITSHKKNFRNKKLRRPHIVQPTQHQASHMEINDDTVRALDWMMNSLGANDLLEQTGRNAKYQHARVNVNARAEIDKSTRAKAGRKGVHVIDSVAIGAPVTQQRPFPSSPQHRPAKILPSRKQKLIAHKEIASPKIHDSDLLYSVKEEGDSRPKGLQKAMRPRQQYTTTPLPAYPPGLRASPPLQQYTTPPLPAYPPDLRASPPVQRAITPILETQPANLLPPPLDEETDQVRYPRNGQYGAGFELDGSSPDAAAYLASEATARPAKILPRRQGRNHAHGVKTVSNVERKVQIGGAYTSNSGVAAFPSKFVNKKSSPRKPVAGLPEAYLKSGVTLVDSDVVQDDRKKPGPFVMHEGSSLDERNTIAAEIERLEKLVNDNKEHFNAPTLSDKSSSLAVPDEFAPLLSDPRLFEDALKEIKEENKVLGITDKTVEEMMAERGNEGENFDSPTSSAATKKKNSDARWSLWGDWGECLCGQQLRTRACETADGTQVNGCTGSSYESRSCTGGACPASNTSNVGFHEAGPLLKDSPIQA